MEELVNVITPLHKKSARNYIERMVNDKVRYSEVARRYDFDYWDGERGYGYGGYKYDGRWKPVAEQLIKIYDLKPNSKILDVGCGKAHLLYELNLLLPQAELAGFDISKHGLADAPEGIRSSLLHHRAQDTYPWKDKFFDLVISLGCVHNLRISELAIALKEIERIGKKKYIMMESYRNEEEMFNLECWALTAESLFDEKEWVWIFDHFGYTGDYEFIFFE